MFDQYQIIPFADGATEWGHLGTVSRTISIVWACPKRMHSPGTNGKEKSRDNWLSQVHLEKGH